MTQVVAGEHDVTNNDGAEQRITPRYIIGLIVSLMLNILGKSIYCTMQFRSEKT